MPWLWLAIVIVVCCVPLFSGLNHRDFEGDESIYAFSVDRMLDKGDWLTPRTVEDERLPFLEKPPLKFWIVGLPIRAGLLPDTAFGMRFWDALMGSAAFLYIFGIGRRLAGPVCGMVAVFLLFTNIPLVFQHGLRTTNMEAAVFLSYAAGMYHFMAWRSGGARSQRHVYAIALAFVLAFMTKDVAALFLPFVLGIAILATPEERERFFAHWRTWITAALAAAALIVPWFVYEYTQYGRLVFDQMFGEHVVKRLTAFLDPSHVKPWHFYFTELWAQLRDQGAAWLAIAGALLLLWRSIQRRWLEGALVLAWFVIPISIISFGTSKLYHYAYPFLPPVALASGYLVAELSQVVWRWLSARPLAVRAIPALAIVLAVLPLRCYRSTLAAADAVHRPLQILRDCLSTVAGHERAAPWASSGVSLEGKMPSYAYKYYLRRFGPWQQRDAGSDATVAMNLYSPDSYRLVLMSPDRYTAFVAHMNTDRAGLVEQVARKAQTNPEALSQAMTLANTRVVMLPDDVTPEGVMLLPAPYSACGKAPVERRP